MLYLNCDALRVAWCNFNFISNPAKCGFPILVNKVGF